MKHVDDQFVNNTFSTISEISKASIIDFISVKSLSLSPLILKWKLNKEFISKNDFDFTDKRYFNLFKLLDLSPETVTLPSSSADNQFIYYDENNELDWFFDKDIKSALFQSVRVNNYLNGLLVFGYNSQIPPKEFFFPLNIVNQLIDISDFFYKNTVDVTLRNYKEKKISFENSYLDILKDCIEKLGAYRIHLFFIEEENFPQLLKLEDNYPKENESIIKKELINEENQGKKTFELIDLIQNISNSGEIVNEDLLFEEIYAIKNPEFLNYQIAEKENLNSLLTFIIYDEIANKVLGVMNIFFKYHNPMFNYKRKYLINLSNILLKKKYSEKGKKLEDKFFKSGDDFKKIKYLSDLNKIYNRNFIKPEARRIDVPFEAMKIKYKENKKPYYLSYFRFSDIEYFSDTEIGFDKNINIFIGRNGYGKSYFLRTIASLLQQNEKNLRGFFSLEVSKNDKQSKLELGLLQFSDEVEKEIDILYNESGFEPDNETNLTKGKFPLLAIPDVRNIKSSNYISNSSSSSIGNLVDVGAVSFLERQPFENIVEDFLYDLCLSFNEKDNSKPNKVLFIEKVLNDFTGNKSFEIKHPERIPNSSVFEIKIRTDENEKEVDIHLVSQGTLSVIAIFGLIYRYLDNLSPIEQNEGKDVFEKVTISKGVIFIDEIDAHLHPSWQQKICFYLQKYFPSVQFFITAHSPLTVAGSYYGQVNYIDKEGEGQPMKFKIQKYYGHFIGKPISSIYNDLFEVQNFDLKYLELYYLKRFIVELQQEYDQLLKNDSKSTLDEMRVDYLRKTINRINDLPNEYNSQFLPE